MKKKTIFAIAVFFLFVIIISVCAEENWLTYKDEDLGFEIKYPKDWYFQEDVCCPPPPANISFNNCSATNKDFVRCQKEEKPFYNINIVCLYEGNLDEIGEVKLLKEEGVEHEYLTLNGVRAIKFIKSAGPDQPEEKVISYYVVRIPDVGCRITFSSKCSVCQEMVNSFKFLVSEQKWLTYTNEKFGFEIEYPEYLEVIYKGSYTRFLKAGEEYYSVVVGGAGRLSAKDSLKWDLWQKCEGMDLDKITYKPIKMGDIDGYQANTEDECAKQYTPWSKVIKDDREYNFRFSKGSIEEYDQMLSSFQFLEQPEEQEKDLGPCNSDKAGEIEFIPSLIYIGEGNEAICTGIEWVECVEPVGETLIIKGELYSCALRIKGDPTAGTVWNRGGPCPKEEKNRILWTGSKAYICKCAGSGCIWNGCVNTGDIIEIGATEFICDQDKKLIECAGSGDPISQGVSYYLKDLEAASRAAKTGDVLYFNETTMAGYDWIYTCTANRKWTDSCEIGTGATVKSNNYICREPAPNYNFWEKCSTTKVIPDTNGNKSLLCDGHHWIECEGEGSIFGMKAFDYITGDDGGIYYCYPDKVWRTASPIKIILETTTDWAKMKLPEPESHFDPTFFKSKETRSGIKTIQNFQQDFIEISRSSGSPKDKWMGISCLVGLTGPNKAAVSFSQKGDLNTASEKTTSHLGVFDIKNGFEDPLTIPPLEQQLRNYVILKQGDSYLDFNLGQRVTTTPVTAGPPKVENVEIKYTYVKEGSPDEVDFGEYDRAPEIIPRNNVRKDILAKGGAVDLILSLSSANKESFNGTKQKAIEAIKAVAEKDIPFNRIYDNLRTEFRFYFSPTSPYEVLGNSTYVVEHGAQMPVVVSIRPKAKIDNPENPVLWVEAKHYFKYTEYGVPEELGAALEIVGTVDQRIAIAAEVGWRIGSALGSYAAGETYKGADILIEYNLP